MVQYWKTGDIARAKLIVLSDGAYAMAIEGEKYPLYGFPRGPVLFGPLARLKHITKNLLFNQVWKLLEEGREPMGYVKQVALPEIMKEIGKNKYDMFPVERMCPAVREVWRAMEKIQFNDVLKRGICFFLQEDDAYRFRLQWIAQYGNPKSIFRRIYRFFTGKPYSLKKELNVLFDFISNAEIVPDMKGRIQLIKRVIMAFLEDKEFGSLIEKFVWELNWKKVKLSKADLYYLRGKYFKADYAHYDY